MAGWFQNHWRMFCPSRCWLWGAGLLLALSGCEGPQSTLSPAGQGAEDINRLFLWMAGGAAVIWLIVAGLCIYAVYLNPQPHNRRQALFIIGGGVVFPSVVLGVLLSFGLALLPRLLAPAPEGSTRIAVTGHQWWWQVRYETAEREPVELANEIHLPVGEPVEFLLESNDVIHAFWIPSLGGKMDMIPGRTTRLTLHPLRTGEFRGVCAEYCGGSHALMAFHVVVEEREDFDRWLAHQAEPARSPETPLMERGRELFFSSGCGSCHTIRGTEANGRIGPDLTHVGSRQTLAAATLSNDLEELREWLAHPQAIKPEVIMPRFDMLTDPDLEALGAYLKGLD